MNYRKHSSLVKRERKKNHLHVKIELIL